MIVLLLILIPLVSGLVSFLLKSGNTARGFALLSSLITLGLAIAGITIADPSSQYFSASWMGSLGSSFSIQLDGMSKLLCLLTAVSYPLILLATWKTEYSKSYNFFALMLLTQAGLMGVFTSMDALLFYFFWELALIPVYFLCSRWGGERRIQTTFKFFVYTFLGSLLMLVGIIYIYLHTPGRSFEDGTQSAHSFALAAFRNASLNPSE